MADVVGCQDKQNSHEELLDKWLVNCARVRATSHKSHDHEIVRAQKKVSEAMIGENRQLVTDEPVEFEK